MYATMTPDDPSWSPHVVNWSMPRIEGNVLRDSQLGIKAKATEHDLIRTYQSVWSALRKMLHFGLLAVNVKFGGSAWYSRDGYSAGAKAWALSGGELAQHGSENTKFFLSKKHALDWATARGIALRL